MRTGLLVVLALMTVACASPIHWTRQDSVPEGQFKRDDWECVRDSRTYGGGSGLAGIAAAAEAKGQARRLYVQCMEAKGWSRTQ